jgi:pterin-4a-carbinolamine dehydratase
MKVLPLVKVHLSQTSQKFLPGSPPLTPKERQPIRPQARWDSSTGSLKKAFSFDDDRQRYEFIVAILGRELDVGHNADITIREGEVTIVLKTKDIDQVTELDREYAKFCDTVYKDITA